MFYFLLTVFLLRFPCVTGQRGQLLIQGDPSLKRYSLQQGVSHLNFVAHKFEHLQGVALRLFL